MEREEGLSFPAHSKTAACKNVTWAELVRNPATQVTRNSSSCSSRVHEFWWKQQVFSSLALSLHVSYGMLGPTVGKEQCPGHLWCLNRRIGGGIDETWKIVCQHVRKMRISPNVYKNQKNAAREKKNKITANKQEQKLTSLQNICKRKILQIRKHRKPQASARETH